MRSDESRDFGGGKDLWVRRVQDPAAWMLKGRGGHRGNNQCLTTIEVCSSYYGLRIRWIVRV